MPQTIPHSSRWHIFKLPVFVWPAVQRFSVWQWIRIQWKRIKMSQSCAYDIINVSLLSIVCVLAFLINATWPSELNIRRKGCACLKENLMERHMYGSCHTVRWMLDFIHRKGGTSFISFPARHQSIFITGIIALKANEWIAFLMMRVRLRAQTFFKY